MHLALEDLLKSPLICSRLWLCKRKINIIVVLRIKIKAKGMKGAARFQDCLSVQAPALSWPKAESISSKHVPLVVLAALGSLTLGMALPFLRDSGSGWDSCTAAVPCPCFMFTERFLNGLQKPLWTQMSTYTCKMSLVNVFLLTLCFAPCLPEFPVTYLKYHSPKWKCASLFQTCKTHKNK